MEDMNNPVRLSLIQILSGVVFVLGVLVFFASQNLLSQLRVAEIFYSKLSGEFKFLELLGAAVSVLGVLIFAIEGKSQAKK